MPTHFIDLPDAQLEYACFIGHSPYETTFILLHEGLGCIELWHDFPKQLVAASGLDAVAYSRQGYGRSSPIELPRSPDYLENRGCLELRQVLDELALNDVILVGHSDGATIALAYAAQSSDLRIRSVIAMAPHVFAEAQCINAIQATTQRFEYSDLRQKLMHYHGTNVDCAFHGWSDTWLSPAFADWDITPLLSNISCPLLLIQGEEDEYASPKHVELVAQHSRCGCHTVWLEDCGHTPHFQHPHATLQAIADFIEDSGKQNAIRR